MAKNEEQTPDSKEEILRVARDRFKLVEEAETNIRQLGLEDLQFRSGDQWPSDVKNERERKKRPCLTINRIPQFIRQITNDQRQNRPSIKVFPVDDKGDIDTARIYQGLIRHIEYSSRADIAYDTAFEGAVTKGFGYFRIVTDYINPTSFEQEILIKRIRNSFSVYLDPNSKEPDGSDTNWGFVFSDYSKDDYIAEFGKTDLAGMDDWESLGNRIPGWASGNNIRVAEYFYKEFKTVSISLLSNGQTIETDKLQKPLPDGITVVNKRDASVPIIKWCKINGLEIIEETDWPGRWIPIVPVYGDELDINGERILEGVVRHAKDSQRMYNYWASTETETIALAPKAPFIVAEGQIEKQHEAQWKTANTETHAYLTYKPTVLQGMAVGAPQRNVYEPAVSAITNARVQASEDMKATTGIYDAALGARGNESSGIAIQRRNSQSQTSNFHFIDNLSRSLRHAGRIIVDLIPKIYDTARTARIIGDEGDQEIVKINQEFQQKNGDMKKYDMGAGQYDVAVETGPGFATKRQEALASMLDLTRSYPQIAQVAGDLMVKNMDWPGASEIAERLKKTLAPGLADDDQSKPQIPPEIKAQMDQMGQLVDQLTLKLNEATEKEKNKSIELESRERIEFKKLENALIIKQMDLQGSAANAIFAAELKSIGNRLNLLDINEPFEEQENQNQNFNESVPEQDAIQSFQQPSGELEPEQSMRE